MLTPVAVTTPRHLDPDAPACQPCPWPVLMRTPLYNPYQHRFSAADVQHAAQRCAELAQEMNLATTQLRYLLRQADGPSEASTSDERAEAA